MKKHLRALITAVGLSVASLVVGAGPAFADAQPPAYLLVNDTSTHNVKQGVGTFYGIMGIGVQTTIVTCFDSLTLTGTQIYTGTPTPTSGLTTLGAPPLGITLTIGLTCAIATSVVAPGYLILWR